MKRSRSRCPRPGQRFGFNDLFEAPDVDPSLHAKLIGRAGGNTARMPLWWWGVEPARDNWDDAGWAGQEEVYADMLARGVTPQPVLIAAPPWARDEGAARWCMNKSCIYPPARSMLDEWEEFVAEVTRRFPRAVIEIWNEPNFLGSWRSGVDPARYAELLARAYDAAKAVNPDVEVVMGGRGTATKPNSLGAAEFLYYTYQASPSLKGHTDAINFHVYQIHNLRPNTTFARIFWRIR